MADFPTTIYTERETQNLPGIVYDPTQKQNLFAEDFQHHAAEIISIETILGLTPNWASASIAERIKGIRSLSDADEGVITIKGANVGIGTTGPKGKLAVASTLLTAVPTYTNTTSGLVVTDGGDIYGRMGVLDLSAGSAGYPTYIQAGDFGGAAYYNLLLNPISGNVGIATTSPTAKLDILSDILRLRTAKTPASAGAAGNQGDMCWDSGYLYICVSTNVWVRSALATW